MSGVLRGKQGGNRFPIEKAQRCTPFPLPAQPGLLHHRVLSLVLSLLLSPPPPPPAETKSLYFG